MQPDRPNGIFITRAAAIRPVVDGVLDESLLAPEKRAPKIGMLSPKARLVLAAAARCLPPALLAAAEPAAAVGVSLGTLHGALDVAEQSLQTLERDGFARVVPSWYATGLPNAATAIVASVYKLGGPNLTFLGHHGGIDAILHGTRQIAAGRAATMLAGGLDMPGPALHARLAAASPAPGPAGVGMLCLSADAQEPALGRILGWAQRFHRADASAAVAPASLVRDAMARAGIDAKPKLHVIDRAHLEHGGDALAASVPIYLVEQVLGAGGPGLHALVSYGRGLADTCLLIEKT